MSCTGPEVLSFRTDSPEHRMTTNIRQDPKYFERECPECGGTITYKRRDDLKRAMKVDSPCRSCAMRKSRDPQIVGKRYGKLRVLSVSNVDGLSIWNCLCDCGKEIPVRYAYNLRFGNTTSCGCSRKSVKPWKRKRPYEALYNRMKHFAKLRGYPVTLSYEEFVEFTTIHECTYCGLAVRWNPHGLTEGAATNLDRKDNTLGYSKDNAVVCCVDCNRMKNKWFTHDEFVVVMKALMDYRRQQKRPFLLERTA